MGLAGHPGKNWRGRETSQGAGQGRQDWQGREGKAGWVRQGRQGRVGKAGWSRHGGQVGLQVPGGKS